MSNPLYQMMNKGSQPSVMQRFQQFRQSFKGNPQEQIQRMLNSGQITQEQYNRAVQTANSMRKMLGI